MMMKPRLILKRRARARDGGGEAVAAVRIIKPETAFTMRRMMEGVFCCRKDGTKGRLDGYSSAGKTGSPRYTTRRAQNTRKL